MADTEPTSQFINELVCLASTLTFAGHIPAGAKVRRAAEMLRKHIRQPRKAPHW